MNRREFEEKMFVIHPMHVYHSEKPAHHVINLCLSLLIQFRVKY